MTTDSSEGISMRKFIDFMVFCLVVIFFLVLIINIADAIMNALGGIA